MFNGKRLCNLCKEKGLIMKDFGKIFSLVELIILGYENEICKLDFEIVDKFVDFFEVLVDYLMGCFVFKVFFGGSVYMDGGKGWIDEEKEVVNVVI